jgi:formylmethanofuran dehydrogenase subunit B
MRGGGNLAGADNVLTWQTGFPFGVNLARGYPRFCPGEFTANEMLVRGEVDAALVVGCDPEESLEPAACKQLATLPRIVIGSHALDLPTDAAVTFSTATYGIEAPATVYRMDDVPLLTRPALTSELSGDFAILAEIQRRIEGN